ncbi:Pyridoxal 5'-phosphate synthase subunit snz1 [Coemansia sp. RSA 2671]|nr:Pyridoxal 5'-phosphate synthase subunit snz1 [Coemansia sp. RSA 2675]KAJ2350380.1 Pyridoxal 5'-phosphate synthase subunit snz1 [Coemansia sp. RSA 2671]
MPTKAEKEREERIKARKLEASKKSEEKAAKAEKLNKRLVKNKEVTMNARVNMVKGGIIIDVINVVQARLAQAAGFTAVCPLNCTPADLEERKMSRMVDPRVTRAIANAVLIPTVVKITIGHDVEADVAVEVGANLIDESEFAISDPATFYIEEKLDLSVPVICGVSNLADCVRRMREGASILRTKHDSPDVRADATLVMLNSILTDLELLRAADDDMEEWLEENNMTEDEVEHLKDVNSLSYFPIYASGGISTPRDVALMMKIGCSGVFVDNSVFASDNPRNRLRAIAKAVTSYKNMEDMVALSIGTAERFV